MSVLNKAGRPYLLSWKSSTSKSTSSSRLAERAKTAEKKYCNDSLVSSADEKKQVHPKFLGPTSIVEADA